MGKRHFNLHFSIHGEDVDSAIIELDDAVIEAVDDEWRSVFYKLRTPEEIAEHVGFNLIVNRQPLSNLDGWADQPDKNARVWVWPDLTGWEEIEAEEIKEKEER